MQYPSSDYDAIVQLSGGFGNQLFQYAFGMQLEAMFDRRVCYDVEFYKRPNEVAHNRLQLLDFGFDVPTIPGLPRGLKLARHLKWLPSPVQQAFLGLGYIKCPRTRYSPVQPASGLTYFAGLWQSPKYFGAINDAVRKDFRQRILAVSGSDNALRHGTVGFHVRRGDYLTHKQAHNLNYAAYISAALEKIAEVTGKSDLLLSVYSDDPEWCAAHLSAPRIEINRGGTMLDDFLGLMECEHKIISNSTFAWWAAFLGEPGQGLICAPKRWFADADSREAAILMGDWMEIDD